MLESTKFFCDAFSAEHYLDSTTKQKVLLEPGDSWAVPKGAF
jgi:hypothetical protein